MGRALGQVFAVMAQAVLSDLDGVEVALRSPLSGQGHTWVEKREAEKGDEDSGASVGSFLVVTFIVLKYLCLHNHLVFFLLSSQACKDSFLDGSLSQQLFFMA